MRRLVLIVVALPTFAFADVLSETPAPKPMTVIAPKAKPVAAAATPSRKVSQVSLAAPASGSTADPSECRMTCAQTRYVCDAARGDTDCPSAWSRCVATCASPSLDPGNSTAP